MLDEINPIAAIFGIIGGLIGFIVAGSMMPSIVMKMLSFVLCTVAGYAVCSRIFQ